MNSDDEDDFIIIGNAPRFNPYAKNNNDKEKGTTESHRPVSEILNNLDYDSDQDDLVDVSDDICGPLPLSKDTALFKLEQYTNESDDEECDEEFITTTKRIPKSNDALFDDIELKTVEKPIKPTPSLIKVENISPKPLKPTPSVINKQQQQKPHKRHGLVALFKKNAGMSEEEYEGATLNALAREQREYYEKCNTLWDSKRPCDLVTTGYVTLTLQFPENKSVRQIRVDLRSTSTEVLYQAIKEYCKDFGKKAKSLDPRHFDFSLKSLSSSATREYLMTCASNENPYLPLLPGAPMWLYSLCSKDMLILSRKTGDRAAAAFSESFGEEEFVDELYVILKVVLIEYNAATTIKLPRFLLVKTLMNVINSYKWNQAGVHYRTIDSKNFRYYGLYYLGQDEKWIYLDPEQPLATYPLPNLGIIILRRKKIIELEFQCAIGPNASKFVVPTQKQTTDGKPPEKLRVSLSLEYTLSEAEEFLTKWVYDIFGQELSPYDKGDNANVIDPLGAHKKDVSVLAEDGEDEYERKKKEDEIKRKKNMPRLKCRSNKLDGATLEDSYIVSGDFMELRQNEDAVQFIVKYTPQSELHRAIEGSQGVDFDGECILMDKLENIYHFYIPSPVSDEPKTKVVNGSVSITNYQLIFRTKEKDGSFKIPLGLISKVEKTVIGEHYGLSITCKDFRYVHFITKTDEQRKTLYFRLTSACNKPSEDYTAFFAYSYHSPFEQNGWLVYDAEKEFFRQGVIGNDCGWKFTKLNSDFSLCDTYPSLLVVPAAASDDMIRQEAACRSRKRFPVLCWRDVYEGVSITRCSQPCIGFTGKVFDLDQEYIKYIRITNKTNPKTLYILDSRPKANALVNRARGGGYEDTTGQSYPGCKLDFENIPNIHVVRESYNQMRELSQPEINENNISWYGTIEQSRWLEMCRTILTSVNKGVRLIHQDKTSIMIHCSDGWDRTSQCCSLTSMCLDSYYRTIVGFEVLIEKDWVSFGHKFHQRYGHGELKPSDQRSPIFPQFIFCVYQMLVQFPSSFQFNEQFLLVIMEHLYSCRFGTFLFNTDRERKEKSVRDRTVSLWSYINTDPDRFINPLFDQSISELVLYPDPSYRKLKMWDKYFYDWYYRLESNSPVKASRESSTTAEIAASLKAKVSKLQQQVDEYRTKNELLQKELDALKKSIQMNAPPPPPPPPLPPPPLPSSPPPPLPPSSPPPLPSSSPEQQQQQQ